MKAEMFSFIRDPFLAPEIVSFMSDSEKGSGALPRDERLLPWSHNILAAGVASTTPVTQAALPADVVAGWGSLLPPPPPGTGHPVMHPGCPSPGTGRARRPQHGRPWVSVLGPRTSRPAEHQTEAVGCGETEPLCWLSKGDECQSKRYSTRHRIEWWISKFGEHVPRPQHVISSKLSKRSRKT